jgi:acetylornithine deacetylase/succinyl-diaminopimelate desuccinylase-like protein
MAREEGPVVDGEERMYGRGTVDMKGSNEAAIQAILLAAQDMQNLKKPLYLAITHIEELGPGLAREDFMAAIKKMEDEAQCPVEPETVIVAEPTDSDILFAHKGGTGFIIDVQGNERAHAFDYVSMLAGKLVEIQEKLIQDSNTHDTIFNPPYAVINVGMLRYDPAVNKSNIEIHTRLTSMISF